MRLRQPSRRRRLRAALAFIEPRDRGRVHVVFAHEEQLVTADHREPVVTLLRRRVRVAVLIMRSSRRPDRRARSRAIRRR